MSNNNFNKNNSKGNFEEGDYNEGCEKDIVEKPSGDSSNPIQFHQLKIVIQPPQGCCHCCKVEKFSFVT